MCMSDLEKELFYELLMAKISFWGEKWEKWPFREVTFFSWKVIL
jgi:hypothetical protein